MLLKKIALTGAGFAAGVAMTLATVGAVATPVAAQHGDHALMVAQKAQVASTTFQLDKSSFHDIDVQASEGKIMAGALGNVRRARVATQATEWPDALKPMADDLVTQMKTPRRRCLSRQRRSTTSGTISPRPSTPGWRPARRRRAATATRTARR
jgi:hypothetical protein